jgi:hypothetical protein
MDEMLNSTLLNVLQIMGADGGGINIHYLRPRTFLQDELDLFASLIIFIRRKKNF